MKYFKIVGAFLLRLLFPLRCPVCDEILRRPGEGVCRECRGTFRPISKPWCLRCGKQLLQGGMYCRECAEGEHVFVRGRSLYQYDSCAEAIYRFKYGGRREYGDYFGQEIAVGLGDFIRGVSPDALVPIPLHKKRFRKRGYNQAKALAVAVSRYTGVPVENNLLVRVKNTRPLKQLNPKERQNNLKKAFKLTENDVKLKTIVLIDDIYTSGSTVDEAARTLKAGGVKDVYVVTLAGGKAW